MKNISNFISESTNCDNGYFDLYTGSKNSNTKYEFVVIFPAGALEIYSEQCLLDIINKGDEDWDDPDLMDTYIELSELPADGKWHTLSGPIDKGELTHTFGQHCKIKL